MWWWFFLVGTRHAVLERHRVFQFAFDLDFLQVHSVRFYLSSLENQEIVIYKLVCSLDLLFTIVVFSKALNLLYSEGDIVKLSFYLGRLKEYAKSILDE